MTDRSAVPYRRGTIFQQPNRLYNTACATAVGRNPDHSIWGALGRSAARIVLAE
jgi:hypothetical protein